MTELNPETQVQGYWVFVGLFNFWCKLHKKCYIIWRRCDTFL